MTIFEKIARARHADEFTSPWDDLPEREQRQKLAEAKELFDALAAGGLEICEADPWS